MRALLALLGFVSLLAFPVEAAAKWLSLRTDNFLVIGNARDSQLRTIALRLEQFREVVKQASPVLLQDESAPPVVVLVFRDYKTYEPFLPLAANGRAVRVGGYFLGGQDVNFITMTTELGDGVDRAVFHEFSHLLTRGVFADAPLWFNEGLAEYYSSFEVVNGGRRAHIGKIIPEHLAVLRRERLRLTRFYAIDRNSREYTTETTDRQLLYAQAWAVVHHAFHGPSKRGDQLLEFANKLARGGQTESSFKEAYGIELAQLERELQQYVANHTYEHMYIDFADKILTRIRPEIIEVSDAEADAWLGDLLSRMGRKDEARSRLESALAAKPDLSHAHAALGMLHMRDGKAEAGLTYLREAIKRGTENELALFSFGYALVSERANDREALAEAQRALEAATRIRPKFTEAKVLLAHVYLVTGQLAEVRSTLTPVIAAEPANHKAKLVLANALLRSNDADGARSLAAPVVARATNPTDREDARRLLEAAANLIASRDRSASGSARAPKAPPTGVADAPVSGATANVPRMRPELRPLGAGERRTLGRFEALECGSNEVVIVVRTIEAVVRTRARNLSDVELISYRALSNMAVPFGPQNPAMEVYVTWRPPTSDSPSDLGTAIAIEVLPEGFKP